MDKFAPMNELGQFFQEFITSLEDDVLVKVTLSKPKSKSTELKNVYIRPIILKGERAFSFTYHYSTYDQTKNYSPKESVQVIKELIDDSFRIATLFTTQCDYTLRITKKGKASVSKNEPSFREKLTENHDQQKKRRVKHGEYLIHLGIADQKGTIIPKMANKFRQINRFLENVESLLEHIDLSKPVNIVDMGCGKGYLTFALYDYLTNHKKAKAYVTGVEQRTDLVDFCNKIAKKCGLKNLVFECNTVEGFEIDKTQILIALHACDTATDDAISKAIKSGIDIIVTAPCCHKHLRQQLKGVAHENPILKHGIFKDRQFEMVTDTIRALILEKYGYNAKIFEFVSNEHTRKNIMLTGIKSSKRIQKELIEDKITTLKKEFDIKEYYLEQVIN